MSYVVRCAKSDLSTTFTFPQFAMYPHPAIGGIPDGHVRFAGHYRIPNNDASQRLGRDMRVIVRKPSPDHYANVVTGGIAADEYTIGFLEMGESYFLTWHAGLFSLSVIQNPTGTNADQYRRQLFKFITVPSTLPDAYACIIQTRGDTDVDSPRYLRADNPTAVDQPFGINRVPQPEANLSVFVFSSTMNAGPVDPTVLGPLNPVTMLRDPIPPNTILPRCYTLSCAASATPNALRLTLGAQQEGGALVKTTNLPVYATDCFTFEPVYFPGDAATEGHPTLGGKHLYNIRMFNGAYLSMYKYPGEAVWEFDYKYPSATAPLDIWELWEIRPVSTYPNGLFRIISPDHNRCIAVDPSGAYATSKVTSDESDVYTHFSINMRPRNVPFAPNDQLYNPADELLAAPPAASAATGAARAQRGCPSPVLEPLPHDRHGRRSNL